ncbi:MAG: CDGSH iron-sulfur domain-containing protein [bacterium]|nr:CDGSH iron-sulfur domain-containing protein [bacterium]
MPENPTIAQASPYIITLEEGNRFTWCQCGLLKNQPFCDCARKDTDFTPMMYVTEKSGPHYMCGYKHSINEPICDDTQSKVDQG